MRSMEFAQIFVLIIFYFTFIIRTSGLAKKPTNSIKPTLIIHGGAEEEPLDRIKVHAKLEALKEVLRHGYKVLERTNNPMDAVEEAIKAMENSPLFNAGYGSVQTESGEIEMDALIINGTDLRAGSVGAMRHVRNPISVARLVMEKTRHVMLVGQFAEKFSQEQGIQLVSTKSLIPNLTDFPKNDPDPLHGAHHLGTVGAVAINSRGQIAAGTSTGGLANKRDGRVGDSPIIGGGTLADDYVGGVSCTGYGEAFMRSRAASRVAQFLEQGMSPKEAGQEALRLMVSRIPNAKGGVIVLSKVGRVGFHFNAEQMAWAYTRDGKRLRFGMDQRGEKVKDHT